LGDSKFLKPDSSQQVVDDVYIEASIDDDAVSKAKENSMVSFDTKTSNKNMFARHRRGGSIKLPEIMDHK